MPAIGDGFGFIATEGHSGEWRVIDLNGDDKPDLAYTVDPATKFVWGGDSAAFWKVFLNTGSGFSKMPTTWAVPTRGYGKGFWTTTELTSSIPSWYTTDLNGDGKPDLVEAYDPVGPAQVVW